MNRYAVVRDGLAENVILWDGVAEYQAPEGTELVQVSEEIAPGWRLEGDAWIAPEMPENPAPELDPVVMQAKQSAAAQLMILGISEANARIIVGLPNE